MGSASTAGIPTNHSFIYWGGVGNKSIYARGYTRVAGTVHTLVTAFLVTACVISTLCLSLERFLPRMSAGDLHDTSANIM